MAKKRVRRYRRRKGRWSANIKNISNSDITATTGEFFATTLLCQNPVQDNQTVSQQYTIKNVEVSFQFETDMNEGTTARFNIESLICYIMYVPQGMNIDINYPSYHPEYIMAMRFLGSPDFENNTANTTPGRNPLRVKTRLARRLQTGDSIILYIGGNNTSTLNANLKFHGILRWWTKAN